MNETNFSPDDPKLTAYALGELEGADREAVESVLRKNPDARAVVEEIRALRRQLEAALGEEHAPIIRPPSTARITRASSEADGIEPPTSPRKSEDAYARQKGSPLLRFPQLYFLIAGLAAACVAVMLVVKAPRSAKTDVRPYEKITYRPVPASHFSEDPEESEGNADLEPNEPFVVAAPKIGPEFDLRASGLLDEAKAMVGMNPRSRDLIALSAPIPPVFKIQYGNGEDALFDEFAPRSPAQFLGVADVARAKLPAKGGRKTDADELVAINKEAILLDRYDVQAAAVGSYSSTDTLAGRRAGATRARRYSPLYAYRRESEFVSAAERQLSTFAAEVETASYASVRRSIQAGVRPAADSVRIEEMLNFFPYRYPEPEKGRPFAAAIEVADAPWAPEHRLVRVGLKTRSLPVIDRPPANLVFLIDVSGSMKDRGKLPLVKEALQHLLERLQPDDRMAFVTYGGAAGITMPSTPVARKEEILSALADLQAQGSVHETRSLELAYDMAQANFVQGGLNRVILCTDGDLNFGGAPATTLGRMVTEKAKSGLALTVMDVGSGGANESMMRKLAERGSGVYGYADTRQAAEKFLATQVEGSPAMVAKAVRLQVEFNPANVASYRLIGYEKRVAKDADLPNDKLGGGEVTAGQSVTALYEVVLLTKEQIAERKKEAPELRYVAFGGTSLQIQSSHGDLAREMLTVRVRYKDADGFFSKKQEFPIVDERHRFADASEDFKFAAAVAGFGMVLKDSKYKGSATFASVTEWANAARGYDPGGYRADFVSLVQRAKGLL